MSVSQALILVDTLPSPLAAAVTPLRQHGYEVQIISDCEAASHLAQTQDSPIVLVGSLGDQMSRWEFCSLLRDKQKYGRGDLAIIVALSPSSRLTATRCLEEGADACVSLPLTDEALEVQIARLRRSTAAFEPELISWRGLEINLTAQRANYEGRGLALNTTALAMLAKMLRRPEHPLSRDDLARSAGLAVPQGLRRVDAQVHRIRRAFQDVSCPHIIRTIRLKGYSLAARLSCLLLMLAGLEDPGSIIGIQSAVGI